MLNKITDILAIPAQSKQKWLFAAFACLLLCCVFGFLAFDTYAVLAVPVLALVAFIALVDFKKLFYLLFLCIPLSIEMELPGGLGTDLPTEPLMWALLVVSFFYYLLNWKKIDLRFVRHPVSLLLLLHLAWTLCMTVTSQDVMVSVKFFLAKIWYVVVLYFLAGYIIKSEKEWVRLCTWFSVTLLLSLLYANYNHALKGFSFESSNYIASPFYRNHVVYACLPAIFLPYIFYLRKAKEKGTWIRKYLVFVAVVCLFTINFAFTRAAYVALAAAAVLYFVIRFRLMKATLLLVSALAILFIGYITSRDNYLNYAPDFERTVTHKRFESLLEATTKLEDISTMERVYRWVAASYMIEERPLTGWGPGTFYFFYKNHTVSSFRTYVSDNPERSGIHCYYLMVTVEQGIIGGLLFLLLVYAVLLLTEHTYHKNTDPTHRRMVLSAGLSFFMICLLMLMNDFVETDKLGSFFFLSMAILVRRAVDSQEYISS